MLSILIQKNNILIKDTIIGKIHKMKLFILQNIFCYQKPPPYPPQKHHTLTTEMPQHNILKS